MESIVLKRQDLYVQVWSEPMTTLSQKCGISDYELRKICKRMGIPLPKAGHWQKIRNGKTVLPTPLPSSHSGEQEVNLNKEAQKKASEAEHLSPVALLQKEIEKDLQHVLHVPARLTNPDKLIAAVKADMEQKSWTYRSTGLLSSSLDFIDIRVSKSNLSRALRIMDTFIKALQARGHKLEVSSWGTSAIMGSEKFEVSIREKLKRSKEIRPGEYNYDYTPTGVLILKTGRYWNLKEWQDGKVPLEQKLSSILAHLELVTKQEEEKKIIREKEYAVRLEKERIQKETEALKVKELLKFKKLLKEAKRWLKAQMLREYIAAVKQQSKVSGTPSKELEDWLKWAQNKLNWFDPRINGSDELLSEVDKETLTFRK
ncbi:hypothetical protein ACSX1A_03315 [Pontibacter sp. MBLB2868]|uniref:hypothetical protein n=1 Tax=Pontibacter sp. MBLB2868 TaxID=3451555 RepID=UPI003F75364F